MKNIQKLAIKYVPISALRPSEYNPRKWSDEAKEQLKESIRRLGLIDPIIVNSSPDRKGIVIGGHFRLAVAKELGYSEVPVIYLFITDIEKEKEANIRLNKNLGASNGTGIYWRNSTNHSLRMLDSQAKT